METSPFCRLEYCFQLSRLPVTFTTLKQNSVNLLNKDNKNSGSENVAAVEKLLVLCQFQGLGK